MRESGPTAAVQALSRLELPRWERSRLQASGRYVASADECGSSCMLEVSGEREGDSRKPSLAPLRLIFICLASGLPLMPAIPALRCIVSTPPPFPPPPPPSPRRRRQNHALPSSLRGFYKHQESHVLFRPGEVGRRPLVGRPLVGRRGEGRREPEEENGTAPPALPPFCLLWSHPPPLLLFLFLSFGTGGGGHARRALGGNVR